MASTEELEAQILAEMEANPEAYADTGIVYCTVDDDTRLVTVPDKYKKLGVESDEKVKRIWFRFPKLIGNNGVDLSAIGVRVNFRNANGEGDIYIVEDLTTDGDYVIFSWELTRKVTAYKGNVSFVVCAVKSATDGTIKNEWNTTLNKECEVLEGLEVSEQIAQENPDIIEYILANLGGSVSAEQIATAVEEYMAKNPQKDVSYEPQELTEEQKAQARNNIDAEASGTAERKVSEHNASDTAHDDIRRLIDAIAVPEKLPNPYPLTFTGGASGSYDGSEAMTITIPQGNGSSISITEETLEGHYLDLWERSVSGLFIVKSGDGEDIIVRAAKSDSSTELGYVITEVATLSPQILCDMKYVEKKSTVAGTITVTLYHLYFYDAMTGIYVHQTDKMKGSNPSTFVTKAPITDGSIFIQSPDAAEVGQILEVETVDENGKPTSWKTVTIQFPEKLPNPQKLTFTGAVTEEYDGSGAVTVTIPEGSGGKSAYQYAVEGGYTGTETEFAAKLAEELPDALPNPNALTFTGAVTGRYDGSEPLSVEIPSGGGGGDSWELVNSVITSEEVATVEISTNSSGETFSLQNLLVAIYVPYGASITGLVSFINQWKTFTVSGIALSTSAFNENRRNLVEFRTEYFSGITFIYTRKNLGEAVLDFSGNTSQYPISSVKVITSDSAMLPVETFVGVYRK